MGVALTRDAEFIVYCTNKGPPYVLPEMTIEPDWVYLKAYFKLTKSNVMCSMLGAKQAIHNQGRVRRSFTLSKGGIVKVMHHTCEALKLKDNNKCSNCSRKGKRLKCFKGEMYYSLSFP